MADTADAQNDPSPRRATRALTQRYDMNALRAIQKIEEAYQKAIAELYGCDEDDVPIEIDTLALFNAKPESRRDLLTASIINPPSDPSAIVESVLTELSALDSTAGETGR